MILELIRLIFGIKPQEIQEETPAENGDFKRYLKCTDCDYVPFDYAPTFQSMVFEICPKCGSWRVIEVVGRWIVRFSKYTAGYTRVRFEIKER